MSRRLLAALTLAVPLALAAPAPAGAVVPPEDAGTSTATVGLASDAWFSASAACTTSPTGCLPPQVPPAYPAKTLHVGVAAGQEEARTYLSLDLAALPAGTALAGGTLRLPVAGPEDGSRTPDAASVQACLVVGVFSDRDEGATDAPPAIDCKAASAVARYAAATGTAPAVLTVDLTSFAAAWRDDPNHGIALVPAADTPSTAAWHVAFSAHDRTGSSVPAPTATVRYASGAADVPAAAVPAAEPPAAAGTVASAPSSVSFAAPPIAPQPAVAMPAPAAAPAPLTAGQPVVQPVVPQAFLGRGGFAYPAVFLLPLVLLGAAGWLGRALTRDLTAAR